MANEKKNKLSNVLSALFNRAGVEIKPDQAGRIVDLLVATVKEQYRADRPEREERTERPAKKTYSKKSSGKTKECKFCGAGGFTWGKNAEGGWALVGADGELHKCKGEKKKEEVETGVMEELGEI